MKIIIDNGDYGDIILAVRTGHRALTEGIKPNDMWGYIYEDNSKWSVCCNKGSVRVRKSK